MDHRITRRQFLTGSAVAGTAFCAGGLLDRIVLPAAAAGTLPDLAVVESLNYYDATVSSIAALGGMEKFVSRGSRVGILVNSVFTKPGTYVKPQISLAVVELCFRAGAKEVISLEDVSRSYWRKATLTKEHEEMLEAVRSPAGNTSVAVKGGRHFREIEVTRDLLDCDVYINIPIFKDHEGTRMTGVLKNFMGATSGSTNRSWHASSGGGAYDDPVHLSECIADGNSVRMPDLCIADATEVIVTNGPFGPGKIVTPRLVVAGTDGVVTDAFGATVLNMLPGDIVMVQAAGRLGLGRADLQGLTISRTRI
jgi:uncharacterized protein (DUF362 family)